MRRRRSQETIRKIGESLCRHVETGRHWSEKQYDTTDRSGVTYGLTYVENGFEGSVILNRDELKRFVEPHVKLVDGKKRNDGNIVIDLDIRGLCQLERTASGKVVGIHYFGGDEPGKLGMGAKRAAKINYPVAASCGV